MLEISKMLTLSTDHLMDSTIIILEDMCESGEGFGQFSVYPKEDFGWFIYPAANKFQFKKEEIASLPFDLEACFALARDLTDITVYQLDSKTDIRVFFAPDQR